MVSRVRLLELKERFSQEPFVESFGAYLAALSPNRVEFGITILSSMTIVEGIANGGIITLLGNSAGVYAAMAQIPEGHTRAVNITTYFHSPAFLGDEIAASAEVTNQSKNFIWVSFKIWNDTKQKLIADGMAQYMKPRS